jgi:hypothetical protein
VSQTRNTTIKRVEDLGNEHGRRRNQIFFPESGHDREETAKQPAGRE